MTEPPESTTAPSIDLSRPQAIHIVGVGGAGMSAIATVLAAMGHRVTGSDLKSSPAFERLRGDAVAVTVGHAAENVAEGVGFVTRSTAILDSNIEVRAARQHEIPVLSRAAMLAAIAATRSTIAIAGTHGKTTTSSMLAVMLIEAGLQPSFIIGGDVNEIGTGAVWDVGELFVIEADESDGTFLTLPRRAAAVTNVEADHLEYWGSFDALKQAFHRFLRETDGPRVICADDALAWELSRDLDAISYGQAEFADYRMANVRLGRGRSQFELWHMDVLLGEIDVPSAGLHNASNACAAAVMAIEMGASFDACRRAMSSFAGVARRFQSRGTAGGVDFVDDYAHLPSETEVALDAAAVGEWNRIVCVFQPHRYSRTASLWHTFKDSFQKASVLVITDVYASGETPRPGISGKLIVQAVLDAHPWARVVYIPHRGDLVSFLARELRAGDLCLTLGAGDLTTLPTDVLGRIRSRTESQVESRIESRIDSAS